MREDKYEITICPFVNNELNCRTLLITWAAQVINRDLGGSFENQGYTILRSDLIRLEVLRTKMFLIQSRWKYEQTIISL
jgi:hypothetical protein